MSARVAPLEGGGGCLATGKLLYMSCNGRKIFVEYNEQNT